LIVYWEILRPLNVLITAISAAVAFSLATSLEQNGYNQLNLLLVVIATSLTAGAGNIINDIYDIKIDRINKPERPLPDGRIGVVSAIVYYLGLVGIAVYAGYLLGMHSFIAVIAVNILLFTYASYWKKSLLAKNLLVAVISAYLFYFCSITAGNALKILPLAIAAFLFHLIREIIKDIADLAGDRAEEARTIVIRYGQKVTITLIRALVLILIAYLAAVAYWFDYRFYFHLIITATILPVLIFVYYQVGRTSPQADYERLSKIMKLDMLCGLLAFYAGIV